MFSAGSSSRSGKRPRILSEFETNDEVERVAKQLFVSNILSDSERAEIMRDTSPALVQHFLDLTFINAIKNSELKLTILEKWERKAFRTQNRAVEKLQGLQHYIDINYEAKEDLYCIGVDSGVMFADTYQLILQVAREK